MRIITAAPESATVPSVTINEAAGQVHPGESAPVHFAVVFSEAVTGFDNRDVDLSASTTPGTLVATVTGSGTTYDVAVSGMTGSGTMQATIAASVASNAVGTGSQPSTSSDNMVSFLVITQITDSMSQRDITVSYNGIQDCPLSGGDLPVFTAAVTARNISASSFENLFFRVNSLEYTTAQGGQQPILCPSVPRNHNGAATTDQLTNQIYLPLVSR